MRRAGPARSTREAWAPRRANRRATPPTGPGRPPRRRRVLPRTASDTRGWRRRTPAGASRRPRDLPSAPRRRDTDRPPARRRSPARRSPGGSPGSRRRWAGSAGSRDAARAPQRGGAKRRRRGRDWLRPFPLSLRIPISPRAATLARGLVFRHHPRRGNRVGCLSDDDILRFAVGEMPAHGRATIEAHARACPTCEQLLALGVAFDARSRSAARAPTTLGLEETLARGTVVGR